MADRLTRLLGLKQGLIFDSKDSQSGRDVAWLGDCDEGCQELADKLGWGVSLLPNNIYSFKINFK